MSKHAPDSPTLPEFACDVCGWNADACECEECEICGSAGDLRCHINGGRGCEREPLSPASVAAIVAVTDAAKGRLV